MARTELTVNDITRAGGYMNSLAQAVAAAIGAEYRNSGREWIRIGNTSGSTTTITIPIPRLVDGAGTASKTWTVLNNAYLYLPPFPTDIYNYANEKVYLNTTQAIAVVVFRDGT